MRDIVFALAAASLLASSAPSIAAAPCRDSHGKFIKCAQAKAKTVRCKDAKGKFAKCGTKGAKPT